MCDPMIATGLALNAAGTAYSGQQQAKNAKRQVAARNDTAEAERIRQKAHQEAAAGVFNKSLGEYQGAEQAKGERQAVDRRMTAVDKAAAETKSVGLPTAGSAPQVVRAEAARKMAGASADARAEASRAAKLGGFGDLFFNNSQMLTGNRSKLGTIGDFSARSAGLLPYEQQVAAANATKAPGMFGDLLKLAGTAATIYGATGGNFGKIADMFSGGGHARTFAPDNASWLISS